MQQLSVLVDIPCEATRSFAKARYLFVTKDIACSFDKSLIEDFICWEVCQLGSYSKYVNE